MGYEAKLAFWESANSFQEVESSFRFTKRKGCKDTSMCLTIASLPATPDGGCPQSDM